MTTRTITRRIPSHNPYGNLDPNVGTYTTRERSRADHDTVLRNFARADTARRVGMINLFLEEATSSSEETLVYRALRQTPYEQREFLGLIEALDCRRLARELENDPQAGMVMRWTAVAYHQENAAPGRAFAEQLFQHAEQQHEGAIDVFLANIEPPIYQRIEPGVLLNATRKLAAGSASRGESRTVGRMFGLMSWPQFNAVVERGNVELVRLLRSSLQYTEVRQIFGRMRSPQASDTVKRLAESRTTVQGLTTSRETRTISDELGNPFEHTANYRQSNEEIARRAAQVNRYEKAMLIRTLLDAPDPPSRDENLVYRILRETPYDQNEFLQLMESLPVARVARKLEDDDDAGNVLTWTLNAYGRAGRPPGRAFYGLLETHCRYQRWSPVYKFTQDSELDRDTYKKIDPQKLVDVTSMFSFNDDTTRNEATTVFHMLSKTSYPQFNRVIELGHMRYVLMLRDALSDTSWRHLHDWMSDSKASPAVQHLALQVNR